MTSEEFIHLIVEEESQGQRLDKYLSSRLETLSRTRLKSLIEEGWITVDGQKATPSDLLKPGQEIYLSFPPIEEPLPTPQEIPLKILYEDKDLLVLDKPAGMVVHPAPGHANNTLVNALLAHCGESLSGISGIKRPGIVHRLDKGTSGLMVVAKNDQAHHFLSSQFAERTLSRTYQAVVWGAPSPLEGQIEGAIGRHPQDRKKMAIRGAGAGKPALTFYKVLKVFAPYASLVECQLKTGRTHQIRVHLSSQGHGLVGDLVYSRFPRALPPLLKDQLKDLTLQGTRPALHALKLKFIHPHSKKVMEFHSPLPEDIVAILRVLEKA